MQQPAPRASKPSPSKSADGSLRTSIVILRTFPWEGRAKRTALAGERAGDLAPIMADLRAMRAVSLRQIAAGLNGRDIPTARGGAWSAVQVRRVLERA